MYPAPPIPPTVHLHQTCTQPQNIAHRRGTSRGHRDRSGLTHPHPHTLPRMPAQHAELPAVA
eukprot:2591325-Prorocentrum_lima.AAC.1